MLLTKYEPDLENAIGTIERRIQKFVDKHNHKERTKSFEKEDYQVNLIDQLYADGAKKIARHCLPKLVDGGYPISYDPKDNYIVRMAPAALFEISERVSQNPEQFGVKQIYSDAKNAMLVYGYTKNKLARDFDVPTNSLVVLTEALDDLLKKNSRKHGYPVSIVTKKWIYKK